MILNGHSNILKNVGMTERGGYATMLLPTSMAKPKNAKQLERHFKGIANHRRIDILKLIARKHSISVEDIAEHLACNFKTVSEHTRRLVHAGLVDKRYKGRTVLQTLSPYGKIIHEFVTTFQHS